MPLPETILNVVAPFRPLFTAPTWRKLMTLLTGTLLARGRRTVCSALRFAGEQENEHWSLYHQVLNRARWSPLAASRCLLQLILETFVPVDAPIEISIDETLERRWGAQIEPPRALSRQRTFQSQGRGAQQRIAVDGHGRGSDSHLLQTALGLAFFSGADHLSLFE